MRDRLDSWMPMFWGDYTRDTGHLNASGHGAYLMLIKHYWCSATPLRNDDNELWRIACCDSQKEWKKLRPQIIRFFVEDGGSLRHKRIDAELAKTKTISRAKAEAGKLGAEKRWQNDGRAMARAIVVPSENDGKSIASHSHIRKKKEYSLREASEGSPDPKKQLWREGLAILIRLLGKPEGPMRKLLGKLLDAAQADHERLLGILRRAEIEQPSDPVAWLTAAAQGVNGHEPDLLGGEDPWGLKRWVVTEPDAVETASFGQMVYGIGGFDAVVVGTMIAEAAGLAPTWRGSWEPLGRWLREGIDSDTILAGIRKRVEWSEYAPPDHLGYFEKPVREAHVRSVRAMGKI